MNSLQSFRDSENNIILYPPSSTSMEFPETLITKHSDKVNLSKRQLKAVEDIWNHLIRDNYRAALLEAGAGQGKTFVAGELIYLLHKSGWIRGKTFSPYPVLYVTPPNVMEQATRVFRDLFGLRVPEDVLVTSYEQLRSSFGEQFIKESTIIKDGEPEIILSWYPNFHSLVFIWDECHKLKNWTLKTLAARIQAATSEIHSPLGPVKQFFMSATPGTCVNDMRYFVLAVKDIELQ